MLINNILEIGANNLEEPLHSQRGAIWCAFWTSWTIFFENTLAIVNGWNINLKNIWFQQDDATPQFRKSNHLIIESNVNFSLGLRL